MTLSRIYRCAALARQRGTCGAFAPWRVTIFLYLFACSFVCNTSAQISPDASAQKETASQETSAARQLFESVCAGCHGLDGRGGERGPDISTRQQIVQLSDADILEVLRAGKPAAGMPPFDSFGADKLKQLVAYLRVLQGKGASAAPPGNPRNGKTLFFGKARCSECHTIQGSGGFLGRDLSSYGATLSPSDIRSGIVRPDLANKANKLAVITLRDSRKFTGVIRNEDNFSIQLQSPDGTFHFLARSGVAKLEVLPEPIMPTDYGSTLKPSELDDLVGFLVSASKAEKAERKDEDDE